MASLTEGESLDMASTTPAGSPPTTADRYDVVVVGAGLAGLAAARLCAAEGRSVVVIDAHPGGRARSDNTAGFVFNRGPHALYRGGATERVLGHLGVTYRGGPPDSATGVMTVDGQQHRLPGTAGALASNRYLGLRDKASLAKLFARLPKLRAADFAGVTVDEWLADTRPRARHVALLGVRTSTYCDQPHRLSAEVAITALQAPGVLYIDGGWQHLVNQLIVGLDIRRETALSVTPGEVVTDRGHYRAAAVIVAVGTPAAAAQLTGVAAFDVAEPVETACLDLGLSARPRAGLSLSVDEPIYFSCHSPAAALAPAGRFVAHAAWYHDPSSPVEPAEIRRRLEAHCAAAGVSAATIEADRYLHRMTAVGALPTAASGGLAGRPAVDALESRDGLAGVSLAGDWVGGEGQLADAAFASAAVAARRACTVRR